MQPMECFTVLIQLQIYREIYLREFKMPQINQWARINPCGLLKLKNYEKYLPFKEELKKHT